MVTIGVDQSLSNNAMYEHMCLENIKKIYKIADKYDNHQPYKAIIEAEMVSTPEGGTDNITIFPSQSVTVKIPSARKSLHQFLEALDVKHINSVHRLGAVKSKYRVIIAGNTMWPIIYKRRGRTIINQSVKEALYKWILHHPHVVQSTIKIIVFAYRLMVTQKTISAKVVIASFCKRTT